MSYLANYSLKCSNLKTLSAFKTHVSCPFNFRLKTNHAILDFLFKFAFKAKSTTNRIPFKQRLLCVRTCH